MYRWDPELYAASSSAQQNWGHELISKLSLRGNERLLDVGCGDGRLSAEIAKNFPEGSVLGIDLSEEMVAFARKHFPPEEFPNLSFMQADARDLPFASEFDVIFSNAALHWIKDPRPALAAFRKSLKPGGRLLVQLAGRGNAAEILEVLDSMLSTEKWSPYFRDFGFPYGFYGPEEYGEWLEAAGFFPRRMELVPKNMLLGGEDGLSAWIASTWHPFTQKIPESLKQEFIAELVERYVKSHPPDAKGAVQVRMLRLEIEACLEKKLIFDKNPII
jgi:trans-aconitate 2-methyltransferase